MTVKSTSRSQREARADQPLWRVAAHPRHTQGAPSGSAQLLSHARLRSAGPASVGVRGIVGDAVPGAPGWATLIMKGPAETGVIAGPDPPGFVSCAGREAPRGVGTAGSRRGVGGR